MTLASCFSVIPTYLAPQPGSLYWAVHNGIGWTPQTADEFARAVSQHERNVEEYAFSYCSAKDIGTDSIEDAEQTEEWNDDFWWHLEEDDRNEEMTEIDQWEDDFYEDSDEGSESELGSSEDEPYFWYG